MGFRAASGVQYSARGLGLRTLNPKRSEALSQNCTRARCDRPVLSCFLKNALRMLPRIVLLCPWKHNKNIFSLSLLMQESKPIP